MSPGMWHWSCCCGGGGGSLIVNRTNATPGYYPVLFELDSGDTSGTVIDGMDGYTFKTAPVMEFDEFHINSLAFVRSTDNQLVWALQSIPPGFRVCEDIQSGGSPVTMGSISKAWLDTDNEPHILCLASGTGYPTIISRAGANWSVQTVESRLVTTPSFLSLSPTNAEWCAYGTNHVYAGTPGAVDRIHNGSVMGYGSAQGICVSPDAIPYVVITDGGGAPYRTWVYKRFGASDWRYSQVGTNGSSVSIACGRDGILWVAYMDGQNLTLAHANPDDIAWDSSTTGPWTTQIVDNRGLGYVYGGQMVIDQDDVPVIGCQWASTSNLNPSLYVNGVHVADGTHASALSNTSLQLAQPNIHQTA